MISLEYEPSPSDQDEDVEGGAATGAMRLPGLDAAGTDRIIDAARVVLAADAFGAAERALEESVRYALTRKQFNRVVASFQGVKHICAEAYAELEPLRAFLWYAAFAWDEKNDDAAAWPLRSKRMRAKPRPPQ